MDEMSLEVWNSKWRSCMQMKRDTFIVSYKLQIFLLGQQKGVLGYYSGALSVMVPCL